MYKEERGRQQCFACFQICEANASRRLHPARKPMANKPIHSALLHSTAILS